MSEDRMLDRLFEKLYTFFGRNLTAKEEKNVASYIKGQGLVLEDEVDVEAAFDSFRHHVLAQGTSKLPKFDDQVRDQVEWMVPSRI